MSGWNPPNWGLINSVRTLDGIQQQLVLIPAQYSPVSSQVGVERRFNTITYTVYYSSTQDYLPPTIWTVQATPEQNSVEVTVETTDYSDVVRVAVAYTTGDGQWRIVELNQSSPDSEYWVGSLPQHPHLEFFVQAVDSGGKVAVQSNRGQYFIFDKVFLPLVSHFP
jgi:hypothetical protein